MIPETDFQRDSTTWILTDHFKIGTHHQCLGLADSLDLSSKLYKLNARSIWKILPPFLWFRPLKGIQESLTPPWPSLIIGGGRTSAAPTAAIGRFGVTKTIFLQNPGMNLRHFDVIIAPFHDRLEGPNVLSVLGTIHAVTEDKLQGAYAQWHSFFDKLASPRMGVILGGDSRHHTVTSHDMDRLADCLNHRYRAGGGSFLITPSRRTRPDTLHRLLSRLEGPFYCWDGQGDNPYLGILSCSDQLCVTNDSVSMMSEACYTGKPVYVFDFGLTSSKFNHFLQTLLEKRHVHLMEPVISETPTFRLDERTRIQPELRKILWGT